jgi:hypothetical protein
MIRKTSRLASPFFGRGLNQKLSRQFNASNLISVFIDDKEHKVERGMTIFQACYHAG